MYKEFVEDFQALILNTLRQKEYQCFIGGSRRFGYTHATSDVDVVVFTGDHLGCGNRKTEQLERFLMDSGFHCQGPGYVDSPAVIPPNCWQLGQLVHVVVHYNEKEYNELKDEHDAIEKLMLENPEIADFIKKIRPHLNLKGGDLYRLLKEQFDGKEVEVNGRKIKILKKPV